MVQVKPAAVVQDIHVDVQVHLYTTCAIQYCMVNTCI